MPSNVNDRVPRDQAKIPNVRNWAVRDYGNRVGIWRLMEVLSRYAIRASAALNSAVCDHHPEIIEEGNRLGWEWLGHNQTNALRLTEMDPPRSAPRYERQSIASRWLPVHALSAGLAPVSPRREIPSTISPKPASATSATGSTTTSRTGSRSAPHTWCHCPIRCRPTTSPPISR